MKIYETVDLTGDRYLNPAWPEHQRTVGGIKSISIHHDAVERPHDYDSAARYRNEAVAHYNRLGPGLQYHYKIDNVGTIFKIRPLTTWLHVVGSAENTSCIAICLDGNFENQQPTREQFESLYQLLEELCERHPEFTATWPDVRSHNDYSATACCGSNLRNRILAIQDKASAQAQLLNQGVFDWPEYQNLNYDTAKPKPVDPTPPTVVINYRVKKDGVQLGAYTVDKNAWQKHQDNPGSLVFDQNNTDVTALLEAKFTPPVKPVEDHSELEKRVSALEKLVSIVLGYLRTWKRFKKYEEKQ